METTMFDFWRMIIEHNVHKMVMLSELGEGQTKCVKYWPESGEFYVTNCLEVNMIEKHISQSYTVRTLSITNKKVTLKLENF